MFTAVLHQSMKQFRQRLPYPIFHTIQLYSLLLVLVLGLLVGSKIRASKSISPLASFEELQPGYPATILENYECHASTAATFSEMQSCQITPDESSIQYIQVSSHQGTIQSVLFSLNGLPLGYLNLRWGNPELIVVREDFFIARWETGIYARGPLSDDFSYEAPVHILSFMQT